MRPWTVLFAWVCCSTLCATLAERPTKTANKQKRGPSGGDRSLPFGALWRQELEFRQSHQHHRLPLVQGNFNPIPEERFANGRFAAVTSSADDDDSDNENHVDVKELIIRRPDPDPIAYLPALPTLPGAAGGGSGGQRNASAASLVAKVGGSSLVVEARRGEGSEKLAFPRNNGRVRTGSANKHINKNYINGNHYGMASQQRYNQPPLTIQGNGFGTHRNSTPVTHTNNFWWCEFPRGTMPSSKTPVDTAPVKDFVKDIKADECWGGCQTDTPLSFEELDRDKYDRVAYEWSMMNFYTWCQRFYARDGDTVKELLPAIVGKPHQCCCKRRFPELTYMCIPDELMHHTNKERKEHEGIAIFSPLFFGEPNRPSGENFDKTDAAWFTSYSAHNGADLNLSSHKSGISIEMLAPEVGTWSKRSTLCKDGSSVELGTLKAKPNDNFLKRSSKGKYGNHPFKRGVYRLKFRTNVVAPFSFPEAQTVHINVNGFVYAKDEEFNRPELICEEWQHVAYLEKEPDKLKDTNFPECKAQVVCIRWRKFSACAWDHKEDGSRYSLFVLSGRDDGECRPLTSSKCPSKDEYHGLDFREASAGSQPQMKWCVCRPNTGGKCSSSSANTMAETMGYENGADGATENEVQNTGDRAVFERSVDADPKGDYRCCCPREEPPLAYICLPIELLSVTKTTTVCRSRIFSPTFLTRADNRNKIRFEEVDAVTKTGHDGTHLNVSTQNRKLLLKTLDANIERWTSSSSHCEDVGKGSYVAEGATKQKNPLGAYRLHFKEDQYLIPTEVTDSDSGGGKKANRVNNNYVTLNDVTYENVQKDSNGKMGLEGIWTCVEWQQTARMEQPTNYWDRVKGFFGHLNDKPPVCREEQKCTKWHYIRPCGWEEGEREKYVLFKMVGRSDGVCNKLRNTIPGPVCPHKGDFHGYIYDAKTRQTQENRWNGGAPLLHWCVCPPKVFPRCHDTSAGSMDPNDMNDQVIGDVSGMSECPPRVADLDDG